MERNHESPSSTRHAEFISASSKILKQVQDDRLWKRLFHFFTLLAIKEGYLTCRNSLGLLLHPFKTIKVIEREKDPVQVLIIFGLPFYFWLGGVAGIILGRVLIGAPFFSFGILAKISFLLVSFIAGAMFSYLIFWLALYLKLRNV